MGRQMDGSTEPADTAARQSRRLGDTQWQGNTPEGEDSMIVLLTLLTAATLVGTPYALPDEFNPSVNMLGRSRGAVSYHSVRDSAALAEALVANGTPEDIALAEKILDAVLACQETRPGHAHYGNYLWYREAPAVQDLNAAGFTHRALIPMMIRHSNRLSPAMQQRVLESIRRGCEAIRRLDVAITYTNIASLDCLSSCLGGELLNDAEIAARGYAKLERLTDLTAENGNVYEFNSPGYMRVTIGALDILGDLVKDDATRVRARTMAARLALSAAMHLQQASGHLAGPHSRAYLHTVVCEDDPEIEFMKKWIDDGVVPSWLSHALGSQPLPMQLVENRPRGLAHRSHLVSHTFLRARRRNARGKPPVRRIHSPRPPISGRATRRRLHPLPH